MKLEKFLKEKNIPSDFIELNAKFKTAFEHHMIEANSMRKELIRDLGLSKAEATKFLVIVQEPLVPLGFTKKKVIGQINIKIKKIFFL